MKLWITIDVEGACVWHKEPKLGRRCFEGELGEYVDVDLYEAKKLCGNPDLPYKTKIKIETMSEDIKLDCSDKMNLIKNQIAEIERLKRKISSMHFDIWEMANKYKAELVIKEGR